MQYNLTFKEPGLMRAGESLIVESILHWSSGPVGCKYLFRPLFRIILSCVNRQCPALSSNLISYQYTSRFNNFYRVSFFSDCFFRENKKSPNYHFRLKFSTCWINQIAHINFEPIMLRQSH